ncbi:hypothetical protein Mapa_001633 [Marchantia paleacea]|nr:hypothetical protein Mapa_001633 [Marchantia paleacea]
MCVAGEIMVVSVIQCKSERKRSYSSNLAYLYQSRESSGCSLHVSNVAGRPCLSGLPGNAEVCIDV